MCPVLVNLKKKKKIKTQSLPIREYPNILVDVDTE